MNQRLIEAAQAIRQHVMNSENADAIQAITRMFADLLTEAETLRASGYSIDSDPQGIRARTVDAVVGVLAFGAQNTNPPPAGHWLEPIWDMARAERSEVETLRAQVTVSEFTGDQDSLGRVLQQAKFSIESCEQEQAIAIIQAMLTEALKKVAEQGRELAAARDAKPVGMFWHNGQGLWKQDTPEARIKGPMQPLFAAPIPHHPV